ncbi:MAG: Putative methyltransferase protein [Candidatus Midichloria mitochondrii]|nr:methyltransferase domain-containing protein [Candidatus Midichloria mitochondrii]MDJ1256436.1 methyltransferase domain-containing protein [Candidatus Midichloria mitochondrii]MDJ1288102.1 methyltransferase domain-containing protein [Candidatus Midichloria mitochondrii]MDJ1298962.1 methyltransferase domain-containing protein [Candidatus Midichloria mitochondrii]MDJ1313147.1 methyltransferase domain-containing protein [Candidatus Midichloria mitochondrii]MDJ1583731.1 methyltransferase domain-
MQPLIFDLVKQKENLERFHTQFITSDFLYELGAEIIFDCALRSRGEVNDLLLFGYFGQSIENLWSLGSNIRHGFISPLPTTNFQCSEENVFPFAVNNFDLACSNLSLHFVNHVPLAFSNYKKILKKDGLFIATIVGDYSLFELREAFTHADEKLYGGLFSRIMPMIKSGSLVNLANNSGFRGVVIHTETVKLQYSSLVDMLRDLRQIGFSNFLASPVLPVSKNFLKIASEYYWQNYSSNGRLNLSFDIITLSAVA